MYKNYVKLSPEERLVFFFKNISPTNRTPEYYVNWKKVENNTRKYELSLNTLNYLIGKKDIKIEATNLFLQQPDLLKVIPALIASRELALDVLTFDRDNNMQFGKVDFKNIDLRNIDDYINFIEASGLLNFLQYGAKKSLVDYVYGVETGLDSNARKNRSGTTMESIVEFNVVKICQKMGLEFQIQATSKWMDANWGVHVPVDKSERRFDVAVFDKINKKVFVIETNYYGGGGSKLKSVCGEFMTLNNLIKTASDNISFIWITDGMGWNTAKKPLSEAFSVIENIFNLRMLQENFLEEIFES